MNRLGGPWLQLAVLGGASAAAIHALWPLVGRGDDPLRGTVAILPAVALAFRWLDHRLGRTPASRSTPTRSPGAFWPAAFLALTAPFRQALGLDGTDRLWAAALGLLLLAATVRRLPALRRRLGDGSARRPDLAFFALPLIVYLAIQPWSLANRPPDGDEPYYLLLAHSLAYDFDTDLTNNYGEEHWRRFMDRAIEPQLGDPTGPGGEVRSRHNALLPLALAPAYRLAGRPGATAMMALLTAALAWMFLRLAGRYGPTRGGTGPPSGLLLAWFVFAFAPPLSLYSYQVWIEVPAALLLVTSLDALLALRDRAGAGSHRPRVRDLVAATLPLALLPLLKARLFLVALPVVILAFRHLRLGWQRRTALLALPVLAAGALMVYNQLRYGNPFKMYGWADFETLASPPADYLRGLSGMFYDCAFGLFAGGPLWLLLIPGLWLVLRRGRGLALDLGILTLPYLAAVAPRLEWYGGWAPPFRYPLVFLPLFALLLVPVLGDRRRWGTRGLWVGLGTVTAALTLLLWVVPGWAYNLADGGNHLLHRAGALLGADVGRLFPSAVRVRTATWIWPLASLVLVPLALWSGPRRLWARRLAAPAGLAAVLLFAAALPSVAQRLPTVWVEVEDGWVGKRGGSLAPPRWTLRRPLLRSGWLVPAHGGLVVPVVPGGTSALVRMTGLLHGQGVDTLDILVGEVHVATWHLPDHEWQEIEIGPVAWPADAPLVIRSPQDARIQTVGVMVDYVEIEWH